jgi:hypothetical protein
MDSNQYFSAASRHVRSFFEGHAISDEPVEKGPLGTARFEVLAIEPGPRTRFWSYVSLGAGRIGKAGAPRLEFVTLAPTHASAYAQHLAKISYYNHRVTLGLCHTLPIGGPWVPGSKLDHFLLLEPLPFGRELQVMPLNDETVSFLWLVPIMAAERAFKSEHGCGALRDLFQQTQIQYWNGNRASVV